MQYKEQEDFQSIIRYVCEIVGEKTGNVFTQKQYPMVETRLRKRIREVGLKTGKEYLEYWEKKGAEETTVLIGLLTTHFTSFFREFSHFEWIQKNLEGLVANAKKEGRTTLRFWSAACSKGQEVWSLAMWLHCYLQNFSWEILGTDIDGFSVQEAKNGVYHSRELSTAPRHLWEGLWTQGTGEISSWYKVKKILKDKTFFASANLLDLPSLERAANGKFDVIICRNVLIYFDKNNQRKTIENLSSKLSSSGVLITGLSESLHGIGPINEIPLKSLGPSIYSFFYSSSFEKTKEQEKTKKQEQTFISKMPKKIRVLSVDDSGPILSLLKKIFSSSEYEWLSPAKNGQEALDFLQKCSSETMPDIITLDLHMPIMDGVKFLEVSRIAQKIPVIVMSSVSREEHSLVQGLFAKGVYDFVEKPTMDTIGKIEEELKQKISMAIKNFRPSSSSLQSEATGGQSSSLSLSLSSSPSSPSFSKNAPTVILNFPENYSQKVKTLLELDPWDKFSKNVHKNMIPEEENKLLFFHFKGGKPEILKEAVNKRAIVIMEEEEQESLKKMAYDSSPSTSFFYFLKKYGT